MAMKNPYNYSMPNGALKFKKDMNQKTTIISNNTTPKNSFDQYKEQSVLTATPGELTLMLYNGIIKFLNQGKLFIEQKNIEKSHTSIVKAQNIISELNVTLNLDYEISNNLRSLYDFMNTRLMEANVQKDTSMIDEVLGIATDMRDTWKEAMEIAGN